MASLPPLIYHNVAVAEGSIDGVVAEVDTQRGGAILADATQYYASLQRLVLSTSLPTFIPELQVPSLDGKTLVYTCQLWGGVGAKQINVTQSFELPNKPSPSQRALHQTQPRNDYCHIATQADVIYMWNFMCWKLWQKAKAVQPTLADNWPRVEPVPGSKRLCLKLPYADFFDENVSSSGNLRLGFNAESATLLKGWPYRDDGPDFLGVQLPLRLLTSAKLNGHRAGFPMTDVFAWSADGNHTGMRVDMTDDLTLPAMRTVRVLSSLPGQPELVGGGIANNAVERIFIDLSLEGVTRGSEDTLIYNATPTTSRPVRLTLSGPLTGYHVRIELVDWFGFPSPVILKSRDAHCSIKMAFVRRELIENFQAVADEQ